jgi:hypothetical protein
VKGKIAGPSEAVRVMLSAVVAKSAQSFAALQRPLGDFRKPERLKGTSEIQGLVLSTYTAYDEAAIG